MVAQFDGENNHHRLSVPLPNRMKKFMILRCLAAVHSILTNQGVGESGRWGSRGAFSFLHSILVCVIRPDLQ